MKKSEKNLVAVVMGSKSDWETMKNAERVLNELNITNECKIISAHRTPNRMNQFAKKAKEKGFKVIIAGAGGAAHLPGMIASMTTLPVIGVPIESKTLKGIDSLLSIVQMPAGVPVATVAINAGKNAGLLAIQIISLYDYVINEKMKLFRQRMHDNVRLKNHNLKIQGIKQFLQEKTN